MFEEEYGLPKRLKNEEYLNITPHFAVAEKLVEKQSALHWHEFYEIEFIISGKSSHNLNGHSGCMEKGSLFLLTPADFHEVIPEKGTALELINIKFSDEMLTDQLRGMLFNEKSEYLVHLDGKAFVDMEHECLRLLEEFNGTRPGKHLVIRGALERILVDIYRSSAGSLSLQSGDYQACRQDSIRLALIYVQHHFREPIKLEDIAARIHLSPNYFSECFHKIVGIPLQTYLQGLRINFAKSLLQISQLPVTEICFVSGFNSLPHFVRTFKKTFGMPPSSFRKKAAEQRRI
jgi:AraC-like DNA-binding protein